jgi:hypothetical protein
MNAPDPGELIAALQALKELERKRYPNGCFIVCTLPLITRDGAGKVTSIQRFPLRLEPKP